LSEIILAQNPHRQLVVLAGLIQLAWVLWQEPLVMIFSTAQMMRNIIVAALVLV
jgi:hypothetical protein